MVGGQHPITNVDLPLTGHCIRVLLKKSCAHKLGSSSNVQKETRSLAKGKQRPHQGSPLNKTHKKCPL